MRVLPSLYPYRSTKDFGIVICMNETGNTKKVLIVDDNQDIQVILSAAFEAAGYEVHVSKDGLVGITDVVDIHPDIIILDIMMPELSGYEFLTALKNNTSLGEVPVIVFSNMSQEKDKQDAIAKGARMALTKSDYSADQLVEIVNDFFTPKPTLTTL